MTRATSALGRKRSKKRLFKQAKGFYGDRKNHLRQTKNAVMRAMAFNYRHRKKRKRDFRRLWISRISVAAKANGISYSRLIDGMTKAGCSIDRKMLSELAIHDPEAFTSVVGVAKGALKA